MEQSELRFNGVLRSSYPALCIDLVLQAPERPHRGINRQRKVGRTPASVPRGAVLPPAQPKDDSDPHYFSLNGVCVGAGYAQRVDLPMVVLHWVRSIL